MPKLATWIREKDEKWFQPFFDKHPDVEVWNATIRPTDFSELDGLFFSGGPDIAPEFLRQDVPDPTCWIKIPIAIRDQWEFKAVAEAMERDRPIFAICKGMQLLNVALGGTLKLDIPGHRLADMKDNDIQPLRHDRAAASVREG